MKLKLKNIIIITLLVVCNISFSRDRSRWSGEKYGYGGSTYTIAASDASQKIKDGADAVANGTTDAALINSSLVEFQSVSLTPGNFNIEEPINFGAGLFLYGAGQSATFLKSTAATNMVTYDEIIGTNAISNTFSGVYGMTMNGAALGLIGIEFLTASQDYIMRDVFVSSFTESGVRTRGNWGMVLDNVVIEFCSEEGLYIDNINGYTITGTVSGAAFVAGEAVTQRVSGATGFALAAINGASSLIIDKVGASVFDGTNIIDSDATAAIMTPSASASTTTAGPKVINGKYQQNDGHSIQIADQVFSSLIIGNEILAPASKAGIFLEGDRNIIVGNRFLGMGAAATGYVVFNAGQGNNITGNQFFVNIASFAIQVTDDDATNNLITGNIANLSNGGLFRDADPSGGFRNQRNQIHSNAIETAGISTANAEERMHWVAGALGYYGNQKFDNSDAGWATQEVLSLPAATVGMMYEFYNVSATKEMRVVPFSTETLEKAVGEGQQAADKYTGSTSEGDYIKLECLKDGTWNCIAVVGTWSIEA